MMACMNADRLRVHVSGHTWQGTAPGGIGTAAALEWADGHAGAHAVQVLWQPPQGRPCLSLFNIREIFRMQYLGGLPLFSSMCRLNDACLANGTLSDVSSLQT